MQTGVDVGGTFTDVVAWDGESLTTGKVSSGRDQAGAVVTGLSEVAAHEGSLVHGTTVATNALLERGDVDVALVTDAGFEDLIEIGRQDRPSLYDPEVVRPAPLVSRERRHGAWRRGEGLDDAVMAALVASAPQAVAVCLLDAYRDTAGEQRIAAVLERALPGTPVSLSHRVIAEFREFERTATTVANAYLAPVVSGYLEALGRGLAHLDDVAVMRSSGGSMTVRAAAELPAALLLSGPAGGVVAATALGEALGLGRSISFDMGGTSTDVCRIERGEPEVSFEREIGGVPIRMPAVAVHTVGAGGGSIGWVDPAGALRVGPHSAGAVPGPASYGQGGDQPTVTDANAVLGRLGASTPLGGGLVLDVDRAAAALMMLGEPVGLAPPAAALGMVEVVETHMERAVRRVSIEEGADPRQAWLVAFGGAGGLHAGALARRLGMRGVVVPPHAGVFSALGLLLAPPRSDVARTVLADEDRFDLVSSVAADLDVAARSSLPGSAEVDVVLSVDVRYRGQSHEVNVPLLKADRWSDVAARFHPAHEERNGFSRPADAVEIVTVRAVATGRAALTWADVPGPRPAGHPARGGRAVLTSRGEVDAAVWWRPALTPGAEVVGPAVVEEPEATTWVAPGERVTVLESGALELTW